MVTELHFFRYFLTKQKRKEKQQTGENVKIGAIERIGIMQKDRRKRN
jgi:hypothetical protein